MPGRYPKTAALRAVEDGVGKGGRSRAHRPQKQEPKFAPLTEHPPDFLSREARAEWRRLVNEFARYPGHLQKPDRAAMIALCSEWDSYLSASKERLAEDTRPKDRMAAHYRARDALARLLVLWAKFGMTPGDRARFDMEKEAKEDDPVLSLLTGGSQAGH